MNSMMTNPIIATVTETDIDTLARTLWGEARGEGEDGIKAVACVILNRMQGSQKRLTRYGQAKWWGGPGAASVCLKQSQFSCWLGSDPNRPKMEAVTVADKAFARCRRIAEDALAGRLPDVTKGADHYVVTSWIPRTAWAKANPTKITAVVGNHTFFKLEA